MTVQPLVIPDGRAGVHHKFLDGYDTVQKGFGFVVDDLADQGVVAPLLGFRQAVPEPETETETCLLYTSDAADEP